MTRENGKDVARHICTIPVILLLIFFAGCSRVHVKIEDQHGDPVEGAKVHSNVQPGNAYFFRSKHTVKYTDETGRVVLPGGSWFTIEEVRKKGYQFNIKQQFLRKYGSITLGKSASRYGRSDPLVIKAWKRGEQPDLTYVGGRVYFPDNVEQCTLVLVEPNRENGLQEPLTLVFDVQSKFERDIDTTNPDQKYVAEEWTAWFQISGAKLTDTDDIFMNMAPESGGYSRTLTLGPFNKRDEPPGIDEEDRRLFIKGGDGKFYGGAVLFVKPDRGTKPSFDAVNKQGMAFQFWFNFDGSPNVMRSKSQTYWRHSGSSMRDYRYCEEAPKKYR